MFHPCPVPACPDKWFPLHTVNTVGQYKCEHSVFTMDTISCNCHKLPAKVLSFLEDQIFKYFLLSLLLKNLLPEIHFYWKAC